MVSSPGPLPPAVFLILSPAIYGGNWQGFIVTNLYIKRVPNTINQTSAGDRPPEITRHQETGRQSSNMIIGQDTRDQTRFMR